MNETMVDHRPLSGIWLPLITPFREGELDEPSLRRLTRHYRAAPVEGFIGAATTGEGLTLDDGETERIVGAVAAEPGGAKTISFGLFGSPVSTS